MKAYAYLLRCSDQTLYAGWTNNLENRLRCHNRGLGSKYTRTRLPVELVYFEEFSDKKAAMSREYQLKQLQRKQKLELINKQLIKLNNKGEYIQMKRSITEVLGIKYPIIQGGMAWVSEANLAAAVSNAGGAGIISSGGRTTEYVAEQINLCKTLTDKPFGVNVMLMAPNRDEIVDVICDEKPAFVTLGAGNPIPYFEKLKAAGIKVIPVIPNFKLANRVADAGADAMIAEGMEAGGHIGVLTTMALMTQLLNQVDCPIVMAGGFADGRGLAAAMLMGAAGIQMGTRFLVAEECTVHPNFKTRLLEAIDTDTIVTGYTLGGAVRGLKNEFSTNFVRLENEGKTSKEELIQMATGTNKLAAVGGDMVHGMIQAGQSLLPLTKIEPCKDIIENIMAEARMTLANAQNIKL